MLFDTQYVKAPHLIIKILYNKHYIFSYAFADFAFILMVQYLFQHF
jgi:hypothetical protein